MRFVLPIKGVVLAIALIKTCQSYIIDDSCRSSLAYPGGPGVPAGTIDLESFVREVVGNAVEMAQSAVDVLQRLPYQGNDVANYADLSDWLFKDRGTEPYQEAVGGLPDQRPSLSKARDLYKRLIALGIERQNAETWNQVRIYCNTDHEINSLTRLDKLWNSILKVFHKAPAVTPEKKFCHPLAAAYTLPSEDQKIPDQLVICPPWLIGLANKGGIYTTKNVYTPLPPDNDFTTSMDEYVSVDSTILHEFTHTTLAGKIKHHTPAYGWQASIEKIARKQIDSADNFMFFAMSTRMIASQNLRPQRDGSVDVILPGPFTPP